MTTELDRSSPLEIERVLTDDLSLVETEGKITCSYEDALTLVEAFSLDMPDRRNSIGYGIPRRAMIPIRDLTDLVRVHPYAGYTDDPACWDALDFARAVGAEVFDEAARAEGFSNFGDQWRAMPEDDPVFNKRWRLYDGGAVYDTELLSLDRELVTWGGLLNKYGAETDPVVGEYFKRFKASIRVDISRLINCYSPDPLFESHALKAIEIIKKLGSFLTRHGLSLDTGWAVINLDDNTIMTPVFRESKTRKRVHFDSLPPPPPTVRPTWLDEPLEDFKPYPHGS